MRSLVSEVPAADSAAAHEHFARAFAFETDCWDVHVASGAEAGFVLLDVRSPELFARGHVPGAVNIPHAKITSARLSDYPPDTLFVAYCSGPLCNGAHRAALRLARLGRPVKIMIGGMSGWREECFPLEYGVACVATPS